jgi:hypothetical protein
MQTAVLAEMLRAFNILSGLLAEVKHLQTIKPKNRIYTKHYFRPVSLFIHYSVAEILYLRMNNAG